MCWVQSACGHLAVQIWSSGERAGLEVHFSVSKIQCLPPEWISPRVSGLPSCKPYLSTAVTHFGASHPAWAGLGWAEKVGWAGDPVSHDE